MIVITFTLLLTVPVLTTGIKITFQDINSDYPVDQATTELKRIIDNLTDSAAENVVYSQGRLTWTSPSLSKCEDVNEFIDQLKESRKLKLQLNEHFTFPKDITSECYQKRALVPKMQSQVEGENGIYDEEKKLTEEIVDDITAINDNETVETDPNLCIEMSEEDACLLQKKAQQIEKDLIQLKEQLNQAQLKLGERDRSIQLASDEIAAKNLTIKTLESNLLNATEQIKNTNATLVETSQLASDEAKKRKMLESQVEESQKEIESIETQLLDTRATLTDFETRYDEVSKKLAVYEQREKQLIEKRQFLDQESLKNKSKDEEPSYGKYIGLGIGFTIVVTYLICARSYTRHGMYEVQTDS